MSVIGQVPILPAATAPIPLGAISVSSLASLTLAQQESIVRGTIVITPTQSLVYSGYGDKTLSASYTELLSPGYATDSEVGSEIAEYNEGTRLNYAVNDPALPIYIPGGNLKTIVRVTANPPAQPGQGLTAGSTIELRLPRGNLQGPPGWPIGPSDEGARTGHTIEVDIRTYQFPYNYVISANLAGVTYNVGYTPIVNESTQIQRNILRAKFVFEYPKWMLVDLRWGSGEGGDITGVEKIVQEYANFSGAGASPSTTLALDNAYFASGQGGAAPKPGRSTHKRIMVNVCDWTAPTPQLNLILPNPAYHHAGDRLILQRTGQQPSSGTGSVLVYIKQNYHVSGSFNADGDWSGVRFVTVINDANPSQAVPVILPQGSDSPQDGWGPCLEFVLVGDPQLEPPPTGAGKDMRKREWVLVGPPAGVFNEHIYGLISSTTETHRLDTTDIHGIFDSAYIAYKEEVSGIFHRNLFGWPSDKLLSARGTEQSFLSYGSAPTLFDGTEGWASNSRPIYYVPIFIKNYASVQFTLRIPVKNYSGSISAALFAADNYNGTTQPTSNGHMTLVANFGSMSVAPESEVCQFNPSTFSVRRGWHFVALSFSIDPTGKVYRSVYSPSGPTLAEYMLESQRRSYIEDTIDKQKRIGSVIRRVDGAPTWPPDTSTAPRLFNYIENPITSKLIYQWNGPDGSVAVANDMDAKHTFMEPSIDNTTYQNVARFNDASYPSTPVILSTASPSPQGGYNLLASAVPGGLSLSFSTRFQIDFASASHRITEIRFYSRSTSSGPANVRTRIWSGPVTASNLLVDQDTSTLTTGTWQQFIYSLSVFGNPQLSAVSSIHFYGYNGTLGASSGNWRLDNIELRGTYRIPESPSNWLGMNPANHFFGLSEVTPLFYWGYNTVVSGGSGV